MRQLMIAVFLVLGLAWIAPRGAEAAEVTIEMRSTPPFDWLSEHS